MKITRRGLLAASSAGIVLDRFRPGLLHAQTEGAPHKGGQLIATWGGFEPQSLFVPGGGGSSPLMTSTKVLERLLANNSDLSFTNTLAEKIVPSADFRSYTIRLRQGVTWHDGTSFTADDVVYSFLTFWKPYALTVALKALVSAEATDAHTVLVKFSSPVPEFFLLSTLSGQYTQVLPKHIYDGKDIVTNPVNNKPIGTGPWKVKEWVRGSHVEYERNAAYWDAGKPYLDHLFIRWWRDPASRSAAFEAGELDLGISNPTPAPDIDRLQKTGKFTATAKGYETASWCSTIEFNQRRDNVKRREVRQALMQAIDLQFIADTVYYGRGKPGTSPIHSNNAMFYNPDVPKYAFDADKAAALLDAAGLKKNGKSRFTVQLVAAGWFEENGKIGQYIKQALEDIGVTVNLSVPDRATSLKQIYTDYDYDIAISNYTAAVEPLPLVTQYYTTDGIVKGAAFRNATGYSSPKMDALVAEFAIETDQAKRKQLAFDFQILAVTEVPFIPLVEFESYTIAAKRVHNHSNWANYIAESWGDLWVDA